MVKSTVHGSIIVPSQKFSVTFTEIFLFFILIIYETLCFLLLVTASLTVERSLAEALRQLQILPLNLNPASVQSVLAICILPLATLLYEIFEGQFIRPAILRARNNYPYLFSNVPSIISICLVFYSFWNIFFEFHERFDIFIEDNEDPLSCLVINAKFLFRKALPCKVRNCWIKVDEGIVDEAWNTNKFILSLLYLTYFLWKWALKKFPYDQILSDSSMMQFKINAILTLITLLCSGLLESFSNGLLISPDLLMIPVAIAIAFFAECFPWDFLFSSSPNEAQEPDAHRMLRNSQNSKLSYGVHGLFFIVFTAALAYVFFGVDLEKSYFSEEDVKRQLSPEIKKQMMDRIKEHSKSIKRTTGAFRGIFGLQIVMFLRTLINNFLQ